LDGACRQDGLGSGRSSGLTDGRAKGDSGGRGPRGRLGRAGCSCLTCRCRAVLGVDHSSTWKVLLQRRLEDTGVLVEGELALKLVLNRGGNPSVVKLDGRPVKGEAFKL